jgi:hypothetical protein
VKNKKYPAAGPMFHGKFKVILTHSLERFETLERLERAAHYSG